MKLYFEDSREQRRVIGEPETVQEAWDIINEFLADHNFKSYYQRINFFDNEWQIDIGSHCEFFYLSELNEDAEKYKQKQLGGNNGG